MKRNYKDDFDFIMRLYSAMVDSSGMEVGDSRRELGWPDYDWVATFYTSSKANAYVASCIGGECVNCYNDNGQIHIVVNSHHMGPGRLKVEFRAELPRDTYPDGYQRNVIPEPLDIELIVGKGDLPSEMEVELLLPYIKGNAFTYADFTSEQIADLKRPATEAAGRLDSFVQTASEAETTRVANEKLRVNAEATRVSQEESRVGAEETRVADETKRREAEAERAKAEESRRTAETKRATEFASWETELDGKAEKSELSNIIGTPTEEVIEDIEPTLVTEALRKVPQVLTPEEQAQVKANLAISKMELFIDLWNEACGSFGRYNPETGYFELNGLTDITYEEAVKIYRYYSPTGYVRQRYWSAKIRTNIPCFLRDVESLESAFYSSSVEIVRLSTGTWVRGNFTNAFRGCIKLRKILDPQIEFSTNDSLTFENCRQLEEVRVKFTGKTIYFHNSPKLSLESLRHLVSCETYIKNFTAYVHADVYAKLTDESNTEWHQVLLDAAEKNITFATT